MSCSSSSGSEEGDEGFDSYRKGGYHAVRVADQFAAGRYIAQRKLGWGQFSTVWLAYDTKTEVCFIPFSFFLFVLSFFFKIVFFKRCRFETTHFCFGFWVWRFRCVLLVVRVLLVGICLCCGGSEIFGFCLLLTYLWCRFLFWDYLASWYWLPLWLYESMIPYFAQHVSQNEIYACWSSGKWRMVLHGW